MLAVASILLVGAILPEVNDPWPDSIGLDFPFAMAGAWGVMADFLNWDAPPDHRDRAIRRGGAYGFYLGALLYALSLVVHVASSL
jgi:hypothetical protein